MINAFANCENPSGQAFSQYEVYVPEVPTPTPPPAGAAPAPAPGLGVVEVTLRATNRSIKGNPPMEPGTSRSYRVDVDPIEGTKRYVWPLEIEVPDASVRVADTHGIAANDDDKCGALGESDFPVDADGFNTVSGIDPTDTAIRSGSKHTFICVRAYPTGQSDSVENVLYFYQDGDTPEDGMGQNCMSTSSPSCPATPRSRPTTPSTP